MSTQKWQPISTAPKDGTDVLVYFQIAGTPIVHIAWFNSENEWERSGQYASAGESKDEYVGWWSYVRGSVTQEKLDEWRAPTHWQPFFPPGEQS